MENTTVCDVKQKYGNIEMLRLISAAAVIMIHVVSGAVSGFGSEADPLLVFAMNAFHFALKWAVPVFLMISGYCILGKKEDCTYKWVLPRVGRFASALLVFGFSFAMLERMFVSKRVSLAMIGGSFLDVLNGDLWDHMWYVYCIIGVYLALPVLHSFISAKRENVLWITGLCFFFSIIVPFINRLTGMEMFFYFPFIKHLFYVCFGAMCAKYTITDKKRRNIICIAVFLFAVAAAAIDRNTSGGYYSPWVCLMAMPIFMFFTGIEPRISYEKLRKISQLTWGVYLIHPLFINLIYKLLKFDPFKHVLPLSILLIGAVVSTLSFGTVFVLKKIPFISKML